MVYLWATGLMAFISGGLVWAFFEGEMKTAGLFVWCIGNVLGLIGLINND